MADRHPSVTPSGLRRSCESSDFPRVELGLVRGGRGRSVCPNPKMIRFSHVSLLQVAPEYNTWRRRSEVNSMNFAQLRDALLAADPLNVAHVKRVNAAEAAFWRNNQGIRVDWSDRILGFECGGEQWVSEVGPRLPPAAKLRLQRVPFTHAVKLTAAVWMTEEPKKHCQEGLRANPRVGFESSLPYERLSIQRLRP